MPKTIEKNLYSESTETYIQIYVDEHTFNTFSISFLAGVADISDYSIWKSNYEESVPLSDWFCTSIIHHVGL